MNEYPSLETATSGSIRFNTDSSKLEIYNGEAWFEINSTSPEEQTGGARGFILGGRFANSSSTDRIERHQISTTGDGVDFGNLASPATALKANTSDHSRLCSFGDYNSPDTTMINSIDFITMASDGDATDFGDMSQGAFSCQPVNDNTRGVYIGGTNVYNSVSGTFNNIEYITIQTTGNSIDFGDMSQKTAAGQGFSSPTRGITAGGWSPSPENSRLNYIQYITISTLGNTADFGDIVEAAAFTCGNTASNAVRGLLTLNNTSEGTYQNVIQFVTTATLGNAVDFGDLVRSSEWVCGMASPTRGVFHNPGGNTNDDHMDYVEIMTTGNAIDFGDITQDLARTSAGSNGHGGLG